MAKKDKGGHFVEEQDLEEKNQKVRDTELRVIIQMSPEKLPRNLTVDSKGTIVLPICHIWKLLGSLKTGVDKRELAQRRSRSSEAMLCKE